MLLDTIMDMYGDEQKFCKKVVEIGMEERNVPLLLYVMNSINPLPKSVLPPVIFEFDQNARPVDQAMSVFAAISRGIIPPDLGRLIIDTLSHVLNIEEQTDLREEFEKLKSMVKNATAQNISNQPPSGGATYDSELEGDAESGETSA